MSYRSKTPERSYREFAYLAETYDTKHIDSVDNILDTRYIQTLFPMLMDGGLDLNLFFEVKSNLRYEQLAILHAGGIRMIQPGIESFSNQVLRTMKKGCTGLQNIQLLRWCEELGIDVMWNILAGFPGESPSEYERQAELLPLLSHLPPPVSCAAIRLDRFSPLYVKAAEFGFERVRPAAAYYYVFPLGKGELSKLAYFFEFNYNDGRKPDTYLEHLRAELAEWWDARSSQTAPRVKLDAWIKDEVLVIEDRRRIAVAEWHSIRGFAARIYLRCDSAQTIPGLCRTFSASATESELRAILEKFLAAKLMVEMDGHYLSLAVIRNRSREELESTYDSSPSQQTAPSQPLLRVV
jgi:ribosomal peptide maturation radical SAM protein 1